MRDNVEEDYFTIITTLGSPIRAIAVDNFLLFPPLRVLAG